jgi:hypothetical protein
MRMDNGSIRRNTPSRENHAVEERGDRDRINGANQHPL